MTIILLTFVATTAIYAGLLLLAFRRVASHLRGNAEAVQAVTQHVLVPLFGRKRDDVEKKKPVPHGARLC
jgi:hypothetical protein